MRKRIIIVAAAVAVAFSLTGCGSTAFTGTDARTVELNNGGTIECVVAGATSGSPAISCIEATYIPPAGK